jgi:hypothetical protein
VTVDTKKIREYFEDYARLVGREHALKATIGVRGVNLVELLDVYDRAQKALAFAPERLAQCARTNQTGHRPYRDYAHGESTGIQIVIGILTGKIDPDKL